VCFFLLISDALSDNHPGYFCQAIPLNMNILLLGSGGREHALAWKLTQHNTCNQLYIAPGNAGTALHGINLPIAATDFPALKNACLEHQIQLLVVGPEDPLVQGVYDYFKSDAQLQHIAVVGPSANAAQLEGSKAFAKAFMQQYGIPTASYDEFDASRFEQGIQYIRQQTLPIVLKADGLAAGKGVLICQSHEEAISEFEQMLVQAKFGKAGQTVVVESFLTGIEISVFVLTDGKDFLLLPEAKDYKRIGEGDTGLNTGGMGAVSPVPFFDETLKQKVIERIIRPTLHGIQDRGMVYHGFIFIGLMIDKGEPYVIEYNCRMGDPETEVVIPRIQSDLVPIFHALGEGRLGDITLDVSPETAVTSMLVSKGYPGNYATGFPIQGWYVPTKDNPTICFHAGTKSQNRQVLTNGGRVMAITAFGNNVKDAADRSRQAADKIQFEGKHLRNDIGFEFD
jgi:phosphoribosylamine--glycine ligase